MTSLVERLGIGLDLVAFVGGGGKSTLALTIGRELSGTQRAVVITTTTKMGADQIPPWTRLCRDVAEAIEAIASGAPTFLVGSIEGPKVIGVEPGPKVGSGGVGWPPASGGLVAADVRTASGCARGVSLTGGTGPGSPFQVFTTPKVPRPR